MNISNKKQINKEEKIHPFLFLMFLFLLGLLGTYLWNIWEKKSAEQQLQDVIRSEHIDVLLSGGTFSKENRIDKTSEELIQKMESFPTENFLARQNKKSKDVNQEKSLNNKNSSMFEIPHVSQDPVNLALRNIFIYQGANGVETWRLMAEWATIRQTTSILNVGKPYLLYKTGADNAQSGTLTKSNLPKTNDNKEVVENNAKIEPVKISTLNQKNNSSDDVGTNINDVGTNIDDVGTNINDLEHAFFDESEDMLLITAKTGLIFDNNTKIHLTEDVLAKQKNNYVQGETLNYNDETRLATFPDFAKFAGKNIKGTALELNWDLNKNQLIGTGNIEVTWTPNN